MSSKLCFPLCMECKFGIKFLFFFILNFTIALTFDRCDLWQLHQFSQNNDFLFVWNANLIIYKEETVSSFNRKTWYKTSLYNEFKKKIP